MADGTIVLECPNCLHESYGNEEKCKLCGIDFHTAFFPIAFTTLNSNAWDYDFHNAFTESLVEAGYEYGPSELPAFDDMLCCNRSTDLCDCADVLTFAEGFDIAYGAYVASGWDLPDYAYDIQETYNISMCMSCTHYSTYRCKPFREWLKIVSTTDEMLDARVLDDRMRYIDPCNGYTPTQHTSDTTATRVLEWLYQRDKHTDELKVLDIEELKIIETEYDPMIWVD